MHAVRGMWRGECYTKWVESVVCAERECRCVYRWVCAVYGEGSVYVWGREMCRVCGGVCAECVHRECVERSVECIERGVYRVCGEVCGRVWGSGGRNVGCV